MAVALLLVVACCSGAATNQDGGQSGTGSNGGAGGRRGVGNGGTDGGDALDVQCKVDQECERFDPDGYCRIGVCQSAGFRCARTAGLSGAADAGGRSVTSVLGAWLTAAGMVVDGWCAFLGRCGSPDVENPCAEAGHKDVDAACCEHALSFFMQHESDLRACGSGGLACGSTLDEFCQPLASEPVRTICTGSPTAK